MNTCQAGHCSHSQFIFLSAKEWHTHTPWHPCAPTLVNLIWGKASYHGSNSGTAEETSQNCDGASRGREYYKQWGPPHQESGLSPTCWNQARLVTSVWGCWQLTVFSRAVRNVQPVSSPWRAKLKFWEFVAVLNHCSFPRVHFVVQCGAGRPSPSHMNVSVSRIGRFRVITKSIHVFINVGDLFMWSTIMAVKKTTFSCVAWEGMGQKKNQINKARHNRQGTTGVKGSFQVWAKLECFIFLIVFTGE